MGGLEPGGAFGAIAPAEILVVSCFCGGCAAGRMARFDGARTAVDAARGGHP